MSATLDSKAEWVARVLGVAIPPRPGAEQAGTGPGSGATDGMAAWTAARMTALASLKLLENAFRAMDEPETDPAIILLRAIQANLTAAPTTLAQVAELENYVTNDEIIRSAEQPNGFGFKVELKTPLLTALAALRGALQPNGGRP